jgi:hypothetical protein
MEEDNLFKSSVFMAEAYKIGIKIFIKNHKL